MRVVEMMMTGRMPCRISKAAQAMVHPRAAVQMSRRVLGRKERGTSALLSDALEKISNRGFIGAQSD
jgi:hypothetical protein